MNAQALPAITPSVMNTKPKLMALVIRLSSVASGGRRLKSAPRSAVSFCLSCRSCIK